MAAWKLGSALACGNTTVLKASEQTPLSALYLAALIKEAGFPPGVVNIINGLSRVAGEALANHPNIDKIACTGSTITGRTIMRAAAGSLKNITLETGGKSPLLVFDDADIDQAIKWSHAGIMGNMGQTCTATSRIYVQESIHDTFLSRFKEYTKAYTTIGSQFDENVTHGPQVSKAQLERILAYVEAGKAEGAKLVQGGSAMSEKGFFMELTIFSNVHSNMNIVQEEVCGPFVVIQAFTDADDAVAKVNGSEFGLGASIFTRDLVRAHTIADGIEAGTVWVNSSQDSHFGIPFGGHKQSGIGTESGEYALSAYTQVKAIHVNLGNWL
ncbi:hypothetical protein PFICI_12735 [Pestalotiopsis fici W106-1]|uniref:Aldehyde dehydrogenase domain-containing protein n=1 Tax=Pestalotiopsis fici (strain W106-1 / CGMCC3.15140) TaxID=1229662 RepID=W3WSI8_PESFW|nr:uncharacterized protein PFICI_12735 [Pestalotiopsis fici W106-1]ETS75791.1 hypothetical protein PFICI_12735 [Pestalotiopsis fici W106-1]